MNKKLFAKADEESIDIIERAIGDLQCQYTFLLRTAARFHRLTDSDPVAFSYGQVTRLGTPGIAPRQCRTALA